jgi:hypothetical protein
MHPILGAWSTAAPCFARCSRPLHWIALIDLVALVILLIMINEMHAVFLYAFLG